MRSRLALAVLVLLASPAMAEEVDCTDPQTQIVFNQCAAADFDAADERLNTLYSEVRERLSGETGKLLLLRDAQRAWITYRDAECAFDASAVEGGSIQPMIHAQCLTEATKRRSADLEALLACKEGDLSCPVPHQ